MKFKLYFRIQAVIKRIWQHLYTAIFVSLCLAAIYYYSAGALKAEDLSVACLSMVGSFMGALLAFRLNNQRERDKLMNERKAALNHTLFTVLRQYNAVGNLSNQIRPFGNEMERAFNFPAVKPPPYSDLTINFNSISFLLDHADPNVLLRLTIEQEGFHQTMESLRIRNEFYVNEIQPQIERQGINGKMMNAASFRAALGERLFEGAVNQANVLFNLIQKSHQSLLETHSELFNVAKKMFPRTKFVILQSDAKSSELS